MEKLILYHSGLYTLPEPDIRHGRKNADFGQGFYLSDSEGFSKRWAPRSRERTTVINRYELSPEGLKVKRFTRSPEWFDYIFSNRSFKADALSEFDVIIGPIANDTLYDTMGIITSGLLKPDHALTLLRLGDEYTQIVIKTDRAARQLRFISAQEPDRQELAACKAALALEEQAYQELFAQELDRLVGEDEME